MSERKIIVPEGMLKAAQQKNCTCADCAAVFRDMLEHALLWLSENPIMPTEDEGNQMLGCPSEYHQMELRDLAIRGAVEWQRRMFFAPASPYDDLFEHIFKASSPEVYRVDIYAPGGGLLASRKRGDR